MVFSLGGIFNGKKTQFHFQQIEPPLPIKRSGYYCGKHFRTDLLEPLYEDHEQFGLLLVHGEKSILYNLKGTQQVKLDKIDLNRQKAQKKGGQSAPRIQRKQKSQVKQYVDYVCERCIVSWSKEGLVIPKRIFIAGSEHLKRQIIQKLLHYPWYDLGYHGDLQSVITHCEDNDLFNYNDELDRKLKEVFDLLDKDSPLILYGTDCIKENRYRIKSLFTTGELDLEIDGEVNLIKPLCSNFGRLEEFGGMLAVTYY